jgi:hypothetical protein
MNYVFWVLKMEVIRSSETLVTTRLHSVTAHKTTVHIFTAVKTYNTISQHVFTDTLLLPILPQRCSITTFETTYDEQCCNFQCLTMRWTSAATAKLKKRVQIHSKLFKIELICTECVSDPLTSSEFKCNKTILLDTHLKLIFFTVNTHNQQKQDLSAYVARESK